jgi:hypothetical protein
MALSGLVTEVPRAARAVAVVLHDVDERVRFKAEDAERTFASVVGGTAKATNVEVNAPSTIPRLGFKQGNKILTLANDRVQLALGFHDKRIDLPTALGIVDRNIHLLMQALPQYQPPATLREFGLILEFGYPTTDGVTQPNLAEALARNIYKGPSIGSIVTMEMKMGFEANGLFTNVTFGQYEYRKGEMRASPGTLQRIDIRSMDVEERGLSVTLDVNDRPSALKDGYQLSESFKLVLRQVERVTTELVPEWVR